MPTTSRALYAYSIHGHKRSGGVLDYPAFFQALADASPVNQVRISQNQVVSLRHAHYHGDGVYELRFIYGTTEEDLVLYDVVKNQEHNHSLPKGYISTRPMFVYINPVTRYVALEKRRPGLSAAELSKALELISEQIGLGNSLIITFHPVTAQSFLADLELFDRIRMASLTVERPNLDWGDSANTLAGYAADSSGQTAALVISAARSQSLQKYHGIVAHIRDLAQRAIGPLKDAKIIGRRAEDTKDRTLKLGSHQQRRYVTINYSPHVTDQQNEIARNAMEFLGELPTHDNDTAAPSAADETRPTHD